MENDLRLKIRQIIEEVASKWDGTPIDVNEVISSDLVKEKFLRIKFNNSQGNSLNLYVPVASFSNWYSSNKPTGNVLNTFVNEFIKSESVTDESLMNEIVDEFGDIIGDEDKPNNSTNTMVGSSKFGSDKAIRQTVPKLTTYDNNLGKGIITW